MISLRSILWSGIAAALACHVGSNTACAAPAAPTRIGATPLGDTERTFSLVDQHGRRVSAADFRGHWLIVYFGFTQCPDVCPVTLTLLAGALRTLGADAGEFKPVFITIDPEHDTPRALKSYLQNFGPDFVGLTGSSTQIAAAAQSFGAYSARSANAESAAASFTHSSTLYVIDPRGRLSRQLSSQMTVAQLSMYLRKALRSEPRTATE